MGTKSISQLDTQATPHDTDLFEVAIADSNSASGYASKKMSAEVIADGMLNNYTYPTAMPDMQNRTITGALNTLLGNFAPIYDDTSTYMIGDVVTYNGQLYRAIDDVLIPESFDLTKWEVVDVTDVAGTGGGNNYSTTEQEIGTWIDGSTLYQKTIVATGIYMPSDGVAIIDTISNIMLISGDGCFIENGIHYTLPDPVLRISYKESTSELRLAAKGVSWTGNAYVTIRYIKTTV